MASLSGAFQLGSRRFKHHHQLRRSTALPALLPGAFSGLRSVDPHLERQTGTTRPQHLTPGTAAAAARLERPGSSRASPGSAIAPVVKTLQGLELLALATAAACQAAVLLRAALAFSQAQYCAAA